MPTQGAQNAAPRLQGVQPPLAAAAAARRARHLTLSYLAAAARRESYACTARVSVKQCGSGFRFVSIFFAFFLQFSERFQGSCGQSGSTKLLGEAGSQETCVP